MNGNKKLLIIAVLLLLMSVGFTTYAIYRESATATGTIEAAAWSVTVKKGTGEGAGSSFASANLNFTVADIDWTNGVHTGQNNKIAPGDRGTITFTVDASGSEVPVLLSAEVDATAADSLPDGMTATVTSGTDGVQTIPYASGTGNMVATVTIAVTWTGTTADLDSKDTTDKAAQGTSLSIPVKLTARQKLVTDA